MAKCLCMLLATRWFGIAQNIGVGWSMPYQDDLLVLRITCEQDEWTGFDSEYIVTLYLKRHEA